MANEIKNQEFNKHIKQLQVMVNEKQLFNLAEKYHNLKVEMNTLTRAVKEKETNLLTAKKEIVAEVKKEETPSVVSTPIVEEKVEVQPKVECKPNPQAERNNQNNRNANNNYQQNNNSNDNNQQNQPPNRFFFT